MHKNRTKITPNLYAYGKVTKNGIQILSYEELSRFQDQTYRRLMSQKHAPEFNELTTLPLDHLFFYKITQLKATGKGYTENPTVATEIGLGKLKKKDKTFFLLRETFYSSSRLVDGVLTPTVPIYKQFYDFKNEDYLLINTEVANSSSSSLFLENSVLCSTEPNVTTPVQLEENTLLGRKDGIIQSIDKNELREILDDQIAIGLKSYTEPLVLSTKSLALNKDSELRTSKIVAIGSSRPSDPMEGTLIFNNKSKKLELFDGTKWRKLAVEE